jgi:hypothetical protein
MNIFYKHRISTISVIFAFIPILAIGQNYGNAAKLQSLQSPREEPDAEKSYRTIGKNNFAVHLSADMGGENGAVAVLLSGGYAKNFGNPEKEGYFFSGELRAKAGSLIDIKDRMALVGKSPVYSGTLAGGSVAVRAYMEVSAGQFLYLEGEYGAMYEYIKAKYKTNNAKISKSGGFIVPQTGLKLGMRSGRLSLYLGYLYFNHTHGVNRLIPKEFKITDSKEGTGIEFGFGYYF